MCSFVRKYKFNINIKLLDFSTVGFRRPTIIPKSKNQHILKGRLLENKTLKDLNKNLNVYS